MTGPDEERPPRLIKSAESDASVADELVWQQFDAGSSGWPALENIEYEPVVEQAHLDRDESKPSPPAKPTEINATPVNATRLDFAFLSPSDGSFVLEAASGYTPTEEEQKYLLRLRNSMSSLPDFGADIKGDDPEILRRKKAALEDATVVLRKKAEEEFVKLPRGIERNKKALQLIEEIYRTEGRYSEWIRRIHDIPFTVKTVPLDGPLFTDLLIQVREEVYIAPEKIRLKAEIDAALTVTRAIFNEREQSVLLPCWSRNTVAEHRRWSEYVTQLKGIAAVGLMNKDPTQGAFAREDLSRFKEEFRVREAGRVKNRYLRRLGVRCLLATLIMGVGYSLARDHPSWPIPYYFRNFFLLAIGSAIGTWLSFSLRRGNLAFEDLAVLEEDRLDPTVRVLFMIGVTTVVGLLFWTDMVSVGVNSFKSSDAMHLGAGALLIGLLAGIAERALGTAVSRRATEFASSVGAAASNSAASAVAKTSS